MKKVARGMCFLTIAVIVFGSAQVMPSVHDQSVAYDRLAGAINQCDREQVKQVLKEVRKGLITQPSRQELLVLLNKAESEYHKALESSFAQMKDVPLTYCKIHITSACVTTGLTMLSAMPQSIMNHSILGMCALDALLVWFFLRRQSCIQVSRDIVMLLQSELLRIGTRTEELDGLLPVLAKIADTGIQEREA